MKKFYFPCRLILLLLIYTFLLSIVCIKNVHAQTDECDEWRPTSSSITVCSTSLFEANCTGTNGYSGTECCQNLGHDYCEERGRGTYPIPLKEFRCCNYAPTPTPTPNPTPTPTLTPSPTPFSGCLNGYCYEGGDPSNPQPCTSYRSCTGCPSGYSRLVTRYGGVGYTCLYTFGSCNLCDPACGCISPTAGPTPTLAPTPTPGVWQGCGSCSRNCPGDSSKSLCTMDGSNFSCFSPSDCVLSPSGVCWYDSKCSGSGPSPLCPEPAASFRCDGNTQMFFDPVSPEKGDAFSVNIVSNTGYCNVGLDITSPSNLSGVTARYGPLFGAPYTNFANHWYWVITNAEAVDPVSPYLFEFSINNRSQYCVSKTLYVNPPYTPAWMKVIGGDVHSNRR